MGDGEGHRAQFHLQRLPDILFLPKPSWQYSHRVADRMYVTMHMILRSIHELCDCTLIDAIAASEPDQLKKPAYKRSVVLRESWGVDSTH